MTCIKKVWVLLALLGVCRVECASRNLAKGAIGGLGFAGAAFIGHLIAYKIGTEQIIADPQAERALKMLNSSPCEKSSCTLHFTSALYGCWRSKSFNPEYKYLSDYEYEAIPKRLYQHLSSPHLKKRLPTDFDMKEFMRMKSEPVQHFKVCCSDKCVSVESIKTWDQMEAFLQRVNEAEAPIYEFKMPVVRRLANRIAGS